jgi:sialate O-acetylesterase
MTMSKLPNTGEAIIIDIGEAHDIHPKNKLDVGMRLARWALAKDYGVKIVHRSPIYKSVEFKGNKAVVTFDHIGGGLDTIDVRQPIGFAIAGEDKKFVWATAKIVGRNQVEVTSPDVKNPVSVRYAWASNPVCNLQNREGLPATPFRTDDWPGVTANVNK